MAMLAIPSNIPSKKRFIGCGAKSRCLSQLPLIDPLRFPRSDLARESYHLKTTASNETNTSAEFANDTYYGQLNALTKTMSDYNRRTGAKHPMMPSNRRHSHHIMKMIMTSYPGFQDLPKGVKKMLLVSESFFFDEMQRTGTVATDAPIIPPAPPLPAPWHNPGPRVVPTRSAISQA